MGGFTYVPRFSMVLLSNGISSSPPGDGGVSRRCWFLHKSRKLATSTAIKSDPDPDPDWASESLENTVDFSSGWPEVLLLKQAAHNTF
jgi:hypothetical protein